MLPLAGLLVRFGFAGAEGSDGVAAPLSAMAPGHGELLASADIPAEGRLLTGASSTLPCFFAAAGPLRAGGAKLPRGDVLLNGTCCEVLLVEEVDGRGEPFASGCGLSDVLLPPCTRLAEAFLAAAPPADAAAVLADLLTWPRRVS